MAVNLPETRVKKSLSHAEERAMDERISHLEDARDGVELKDAQGVTLETRDKKALDASISKLKAIRESQGVVRATGQERDQLEKREKELRERLDPKMTWHEFMNTRRRDGMKFIKLVQTIEKWNSDPTRQRDIKEWKYVRRRLEPEDPNISNTMHLFQEDR